MFRISTAIFPDDVDGTRPLHCGGTWNGRVKLRHD